ncbi:MAG: type 1 glutamine amidotransferase, partial [Nitrospirales bacterium]|nr:type 1 glutamine amidotransferase [Nitrospirales bacterium]
FTLRQTYVSAVQRAGGLPFLLPPGSDLPVVADIIDGLLLPGGDDILPLYYGEEVSVQAEMRFVRPERTDCEISLLKAMAERRKPVLAICYGMQLLNVAFGGTLIQDIGEQIPGAGEHRGGTHLVDIIQSIPFCKKGISGAVNSRHHQAVKAVGAGLEVWALSADGIIEGVYKRDHPFLVGVQWHPESQVEGPEICDILSSMVFDAFISAAGGNSDS